MHFDVLTIFPAMFGPILQEGVVARAWRQGVFSLDLHDLRDHAEGRHRKVDDEPFGGGPGMVLKAEPIFRAVETIRSRISEASRTVLLSPQGARFDQRIAERFAEAGERLILICGRYEGIDERVREFLADEELSVGDFVLTGGEIPAMVVIDAVARLLPGTLGSSESARRESFTEPAFDHPTYTRPAEFRGMRVPDVLLSGHHAEIERWRREQAGEKTSRSRSELAMPAGDRGTDSDPR